MIRRKSRVGNLSWERRAIAAGILALTEAAGSGCNAPPGPGPLQPTEAAAAKPGYDPRLIKIDVHMHVDPAVAHIALAVMRDANIVIGLNASGGTPERGLPESVEIARQSGGRLRPFCNLELSRVRRAGFGDYVQHTLRTCKSMGGLGVKIPKFLGLGVEDASGRRLPVDAPEFDVIFETAAALELPVLIHSGDPKAFFDPPTPSNERYEELQAHPGWSFNGVGPTGEPWPSWQALLDQFERRVARHPQTKFLGAHFGNAAEEPSRVANMLDRYPNLFIDTAARVPEFGRHPAAEMRAFFVAHQDRILFGSDLGVMPEGLVLGSSGRHLDHASDAPRFFAAHWLYFESTRRALAHPTPIQGSWTVDAIGLSKPVLEKLYWRNAVRLFALPSPVEQTGSPGN